VPFSFFDHTGDVGIKLEAPTLPQLFQAAVEAFAQAITDPARVSPRTDVAVELSAAAPDLLLADWLRETLYQFEARDFLASTADADVEVEAAACRVRGTLHGERFDPSRHAIKVLVKAITYHRLEVVRAAGGWAATVILDI
jgi:SHS2 domain-containing protein